MFYRKFYQKDFIVIKCMKIFRDSLCLRLLHCLWCGLFCLLVLQLPWPAAFLRLSCLSSWSQGGHWPWATEARGIWNTRPSHGGLCLFPQSCIAPTLVLKSWVELHSKIHSGEKACDPTFHLEKDLNVSQRAAISHGMVFSAMWALPVCTGDLLFFGRSKKTQVVGQTRWAFLMTCGSQDRRGYHSAYTAVTSWCSHSHPIPCATTKC